MIGNIGTVKPSERVRLFAAVAAFLAASCSAIAWDDPWAKKKALPDGVTEVTREDLNSRMPHFFTFDYQFDPGASKRLWLRVDGKHWLERYPDGMETRFRIVGRTTALDVVGTLVVRLTGNPEEDDTMQVFLPDKCKEAMNLLFRVVGDGPGEWALLGEMKKVE